MGLKIFLDANIILDFILKRDAYNLSLQIMKMVVQGKVQAFITPSIIQISGYWITKVHGQAKAKELLSTLLNDVRLIDIRHEVAQLALQSSIPEIEDALQYYTATQHQLDFFITLDKALIKYSSPVLPIIHPTEFLGKFSDPIE
jgi:predicted nucleic acid-binding protein